MLSIYETRQYIHEKHKNQYDKCGCEYYTHPYRVFDKLFLNYNDICSVRHDIYYVALMHDLLEDTHVEHNEIISNFSNEILKKILMLTNDRKTKYIEYVKNVASSGEIDVVLVKYCDILDNIDRNRLNMLSMQDRDKLYAKYTNALEIIEPVVNHLVANFRHG